MQAMHLERKQTQQSCCKGTFHHAHLHFTVHDPCKSSMQGIRQYAHCIMLYSRCSSEHLFTHHA
jgi:hypothetical protein